MQATNSKLQLPKKGKTYKEYQIMEKKADLAKRLEETNCLTEKEIKKIINYELIITNKVTQKTLAQLEIEQKSPINLEVFSNPKDFAAKMILIDYNLRDTDQLHELKDTHFRLLIGNEDTFTFTHKNNGYIDEWKTNFIVGEKTVFLKACFLDAEDSYGDFYQKEEYTIYILEENNEYPLDKATKDLISKYQIS